MWLFIRDFIKETKIWKIEKIIGYAVGLQFPLAPIIPPLGGVADGVGYHRMSQHSQAPSANPGE